jgi:putative Mg2+ transporter-C (MgtC) family protein
VAALLGSLIGLDRQRLDKSAGLRTHMLVSVGSALFMVVSAHGFDPVIQPGRVVLDPSRVAAQVVSGIGFLGAGTIVVRKLSVHGLTTAASIWAVAAVGLAAGGALYLAAVAATALMLVILALIKPLEDQILGHGHTGCRTLGLVVAASFGLESLEKPFRECGIDLQGIRVRGGVSTGEREIEVTCGLSSMPAILRLTERIREMPGVREISSS